MSWVNVLLWKCLGWQYCYWDVYGKNTAMEMIWVRVLLCGCLGLILLWRWLGLQYCYGGAFGRYVWQLEDNLVRILAFFFWSKNVHFSPWQGMIDFWVHTNGPLQWRSWGLKVIWNEVLEAVQLRLCLLPFLTPKNNHWSGCYITAKAITNVRETIRFCSYCHVK